MAKLSVVRGTSDGGDGPMEPTLDARVSSLEEKIGRIEAALMRLEPAIRDIRDDNREIKTSLNTLQNTLVAHDGRLALIEQTSAKGSQLEYIKGRIETLPSTWQMIFAVLGSWTVGLSAIIGILTFLQR